MKVVGLCGGIGAGKSTVAGLLAERGAVVVDVDALGRSVLTMTRSGGPWYRSSATACWMPKAR